MHSSEEYQTGIEGEPSEVEEGESWIVSYADLMTLLFGFFAMMFTFANFEDAKSVKIDRELLKYFGGNVIDAKKESSADTVNDAIKKFKNNIKDLTYKQDENGIEITFTTGLLFEPGSAKLFNKSILSIKDFIKIIKLSEVESKVLVEGHTDDTPIHTSYYPSNWELSAARAAAIIRLFQDSGFHPKQLGAIGYADSQPLYPNRDSNNDPILENQRLNRRVVLKILPMNLDEKKVKKNFYE